MYLEDLMLDKVCQILNASSDKNADDIQKLKKSISVLHSYYLMGSATEAAHVIKKRGMSDRFDLIMDIYNRKIKEHQALFLLIHLFEIAIRSKAAIIISNKFSSPDSDDWFSATPSSKHHQKLKDKIILIANNKNFAIDGNTTTFDLFNLLSFGDLEWLIKTFWGDFAPLFQEKEYKSQPIKAISIKSSFLQKIISIRHARNEIFHNNPIKINRSDLIGYIEIILLHLGYNLFDAVNNIDPEHKIIKLKYDYGQIV